MWIGFAALPTGMVPENGLVQKERALQMVSFQVSGCVGYKTLLCTSLGYPKIGTRKFWLDAIREVPNSGPARQLKGDWHSILHGFVSIKFRNQKGLFAGGSFVGRAQCQ